MKIAIIIGSTRPGRLGESVGNWIYDIASQRDDITYELVDLADYNLPLLNEPTNPGMANGKYENELTQKWGDKIAEFDGYLFVTPEYNHGIPGAFKNAFDVLFVEWVGKAVAFASYGADGGVRAVEHWRGVVANAYMQATRGQLVLSIFTDVNESGLAPAERREGELNKVLDELEKLTKTLRG